MKKTLISLVTLYLMLMSSMSFAVSAAGQRYINMIANGGPVTVRDAAKSIQRSGESDTAVLDVLAERLLRDYQKPGKTEADAMAWAAIALGNSGNPRYHAALTEVATKSDNRKLVKHTNKALKGIKSSEGPQYTQGTVSLEKLKDSPAPAAKPAARHDNGTYVSLSEIREGMSMQEVTDLAGPATATTSHITGKAFRPFNFRGADTTRTYYLYKGQGRVVFSNESHYSGTWRVREVILDENETGYP